MVVRAVASERSSPRDSGAVKGVGADRGDGGAHLERAGELGVAAEGVLADGPERLDEVEPRE